MTAVAQNPGGVVIVKVTIHEEISPVLYREISSIDPNKRLRARRLIDLAEKAIGTASGAQQQHQETVAASTEVTSVAKADQSDTQPAAEDQSSEGTGSSSLLDSFEMESYK